MPPNPIVVISFSRPHYLAQVLDSLAAQTALNSRPVYLFQDNAVSPHTGKRFVSDEVIAACVDVFRARCPRGEVFLAPHNLGVARNFLRAEEFAFRERGHDAAYFFEDDMVLSPHYLTMMDRIHAGMDKDRVGYFAAYGDRNLSLAAQRDRAREMQRLGLHWAFGLTRMHWLALREWLEPYYQICESTDYGDRPTKPITEYYRKRGHTIAFTTQDHMKKAGTYALGRVAINTVACFARYIGEDGGLNMTPRKFAAKKFAAAEIYPEPVTLDFPTEADMARFRDEQIARFELHARESAERAAARRAAKPAPGD